LVLAPVTSKTKSKCNKWITITITNSNSITISITY